MIIYISDLNRYDMIYLLTAIGLSPGGSSTVHIYTQTIHRTTQNKQYIEQHNNFGQCGPCPVLASYTLAFALQLRKKLEYYDIIALDRYEKVDQKSFFFYFSLAFLVFPFKIFFCQCAEKLLCKKHSMNVMWVILLH